MDPDAKTEAPPTLPRLVSILLGLAAAFACLVLMKQFASIIASAFLALNLVITVYPLHTWLTRKGTPAWLSAIVTMLTVFALLLGLVGGLVWSVARMVAVLPNYADEWNRMYANVLKLAQQYGFETTGLSNVLKTIDPNSVISAATSLVSGASGFVTMLTVVVMAIFFMCMDTPQFAGRMRKVAQVRPRAAEAMSAFAVGVRKYWLVTTIFGLIVAILDGVAVALLGVPLPIVWALFSFLTNYIPNIGFVIGLIPPALVALFANGWQVSVIVIVLYIVLNFGVQGLIQPRYAGESVGVTPTVSFLSLLLWSAVLGGLGSLLALPVTLLVKAVFVDLDPKARWVGILGASNPPEATVQRPRLRNRRKTGEQQA